MKLQSIRTRLLASTMICGALVSVSATQALAAEAAATSTDVSEIVVTGTRVVVPGLTSSSPITSISNVEILQRQTPEAEQFLRTLPAVVPGDGANTNNGTAGVSSLNLRGLGSSRNLVLIDGKRVTPYNLNGIVDLSVVPVALIQRVDVVTGGASAVYGSDAISGAANFILKRNFEGVEANATLSQTGEGDGKTSAYSLVLGTNSPDKRGNVTMALSLSTRDGVKFGDRDYGRVAVGTSNGANLRGSPVASPTGCTGTNTFGDINAGSGTTIPAVIDFGYDGYNDNQFRTDGSLGAQCNSFNFNPYNYYQTPQTRYGGLVSGHYEINKYADVYAKALFSNTSVSQQVAPSGVFFDKFLVPLSNPFLTAATRTSLISKYNAALAGGSSLEDMGVVDANGNGSVDAGDSVNTYIARRTTELGPRSTEYRNNFQQYTVGIRGDLQLAEGWTYDASLQYGRSDRTQINRGYSNKANIQDALNATNTTSCADASKKGCVPINLFGPEGSITAAMAAYASATAIQDQTFEQIIGGASATGPLSFLKSPWATSPTQVALGIEYREERGAFTPDECLKSPPTSCLGGAGGTVLPVSGELFAREVFGELIAPLVADKPFAKDLNLELGYRYADYDPAGVNKTYKAGFNWTIVDGFRVRVMKQRAARAPNIGELYAPVSTGLANSIADPCSIANTGANNTQSATLTARCISTGMTAAQVYSIGNISAGQVNVFTGTDPNNKPSPEIADTLTVGFVWQPNFLGSVVKSPQLSVDYYDISIDKYIGTFNANEIITGCYTQGVQAFCSRIHRLSGGLKPSGAGIDLYNANLLNVHAEGIEVLAGFGIGLDSLGLGQNSGKLDFAFNGNYYLTNDSQSSSIVAKTDCLGYYGTTCGNPTHKYRWTQRTTWNVGPFLLSTIWRHLGGVSVEKVQRAKTFDQFEHIGAKDYLDLAGTYNLNENTKLSLTVTNVTNMDPPIIGNSTATTAAGGGNTLPQAYDVIGRVVAVGLNLRF